MRFIKFISISSLNRSAAGIDRIEINGKKQFFIQRFVYSSRFYGEAKNYLETAIQA